MPDAIGFRAVLDDVETVVVEVKTSRSDFLADRKKPHRSEGEGMGLFRYFMCPEGLISPTELPPRWGLIYITPRGAVKPVIGPAALSDNCGTFGAIADTWRHERNTQRETWLLVKVMARIDNPDKVKNTLNEAARENARLVKICNAQAEEIHNLRWPKPATPWTAEIPKALPRRKQDPRAHE
ncbi:adenylosuccinate synthase [Pseudomonas syringae pv. actinidiae]|nr:adenylosuccinate synthase [Pseudomonas syringae pv. actinidiae]